MIIPIGAKKAFEKIQHLCTVKALKKTRNRWNVPQNNKTI
jgi:hypothetical protein